VANSAATSPIAEVSPFDFVDEFAPPVLIAVPGGTCRTDAPVDAEVPDSGMSTESDSGVEAPDVPVVSAVVPMVADVPCDSEVPDVPAASGAPAVSPGAVDDGEAESVPGELPSSAHATPGPLATATPTPNATANPPTRPTKRAALMTASPT
jgi:hypothetical protein